MPIDKSTFASNMKKARELRSWSQEGAAAEIGIRRSSIGSYEEARALPTYDNQKKIEQAYGIEDWDRFISDPTYFENNITPEILEKKFNELDPRSKKAVSLLLGL